MTASCLPPMPTCLLWNLAVLVLCYSGILSLIWLFALNFIISTADQPHSSLPLPDKLLERILLHSVLTTLFGSLKSGFGTCHSDGIVLAEVIGDFIIRSPHRLSPLLLHHLASSSPISLCKLIQLTAYLLLEILTLDSKTLGSPKFFFYIIDCFFSNFLDSLSSFSYILNVGICQDSPALSFLNHFLLGMLIYFYCFNLPLYTKTPTSLSLAIACLTYI